MTNNLKIYRGDTATIVCTVYDENEKVVDITGYSVKFTAKKHDTDSDSDAIIGPISGSLVVAANGTCKADLSSENTDVIEGTLIYDFQLYNDSTDKVYTVVKDYLEIVNDVTKGV